MVESRVLLDSRKMCERLNLNPTWLGNQLWRIKAGKATADTLPPIFQIGGRYMCYEDELSAWIEERRVKVTV